MNDPCRCVRGIVHGAAQLTKAAAGVGHAPLEVVQARRQQCRVCPEATRPLDDPLVRAGWLALTSQCRLCNCFIAAKTLLTEETCPADKW